MKQISGKEFCKTLEKYGWMCVRIRGSHHIYIKRGNTNRISVPVHKNKPLKIGLLKHLIKIADIPKTEFE